MSAERFSLRLYELDIDPRTIEDDPSGASWLPADMLEQARNDAACAEELELFAQMECMLLEVHEPSDAFFTRRVMDSLPKVEAIDERRRTWILASAYALAIGLTYLLLGPLFSSGELSSYLAPAHDWYHDHAFEALGLWVTLGFMCAAALLVALPTSRRSYS